MHPVAKCARSPCSSDSRTQEMLRSCCVHKTLRNLSNSSLSAPPSQLVDHGFAAVGPWRPKVLVARLSPGSTACSEEWLALTKDSWCINRYRQVWTSLSSPKKFWGSWCRSASLPSIIWCSLSVNKIDFGKPRACALDCRWAAVNRLELSGYHDSCNSGCQLTD